MKVVTANHVADNLNSTFGPGLWVAILGNSLLRGVALEAITFLTDKSGRISLPMTGQNHHQDFYVCCNAHRSPSNRSTLRRCAARRQPAASWTLPQVVADDILARRASGKAPVCISFQIVQLATQLPALLDKHAAEHQRSGIRATSISINPGIHGLEARFELDQIIQDVRNAQRSCARLFPTPPPAAAAAAPAAMRPPAACLLHTTAYTRYGRREGVKLQHRRTYSNIRGYNAAVAAAWAQGGMPVIDAGALSLLPPVINGIDGDKIHYQEHGTPFNMISWQMILNSALANASHLCERAGLPAPGEGAAGAARRR
jgi:hypothetical protein